MSLTQSLVLIRGLPGSGKSTLAKALAEQGYEHVEADMYHMERGVYVFKPDRAGLAHAWCKDVVRESLSLGSSVVVSNTFTTLGEIASYSVIADLFGVPMQVIACNADFDNVHEVPLPVMGNMRNRWEHYPID